MKINFKNIEKAINKRFKQTETGVNTVFSSSSEVDLLKIVEKKNKEYVFYGVDNQTPYKLKELLGGSPIHAAIIKTKTLMTSGDGLLINGAKSEEESNNNYKSLAPKEKAELDFILANPYGQQNFALFLDKIALDYNVFGSFCYEVVWNTKFDKIASYSHIPIEQIRSGKLEKGYVKEYYRSYDWCANRPEYNEYYPFSKSDKEHVNQLVYFKKGGLMYYGEPDYSGAIMWVQIDYNMGLFHLSNIENGMNPGLHFKFRTNPESDNAKQDILDDIKSTYKGAKNTGKFLATFSSSIETETEVSPIESSTLDKQLVHLSELCDRKILSGHQLTSPLLAGVSTPGQLGGNTELELAYKLYDNMVMEKARKDVIDSLNKHIFSINIPNIKIDINPFSPLKEKLLVKQDKGTLDALNSLSPLVANKVLESMSPEEIRGLIGLKGAGVTQVNNTPNA